MHATRPRKPITYVQAPTNDTFVRHRLPSNLAPIEAWPEPHNVPVSLRHTLVSAHHSGFTAEELSEVYELPVSWIRLFVEDSAGCA